MTTRPLEDFEIQKIFSGIEGTYAKRNEALLVVGIGLALRATELISLTVGDIADFDGAVKTYVTVRGETSKYGKGRVVRIGAEIRAALDSFLKWKRERGESLLANAPLFASRKGGAHLSRQALFHLIKKILSGAGIDQSPHCLRKTGGTLYYIESNFDLIAAQQFLGHSDPSTTRAYIGLTSEQLAEYSEKLSTRLFRAMAGDGVKSNRKRADFSSAADADLILELQQRGYNVSSLLAQRNSPRTKPSDKVIPITALVKRA